MTSGGQIQSSRRAFPPVNIAVPCEEGSPSVTVGIKVQEMCSCYLAGSMHPIQNTYSTMREPTALLGSSNKHFHLTGI